MYKMGSRTTRSGTWGIVSQGTDEKDGQSFRWAHDYDIAVFGNVYDNHVMSLGRGFRGHRFVPSRVADYERRDIARNFIL